MKEKKINKIVPIEIIRENDKLNIRWSDQLSSSIKSDYLRKQCPCAHCKIKRGEDTHTTPLTPRKISLAIVEHTLEESIKIEKIWSVGGYAIGISWGDGHNDGIYSYEYLREIAGGVKLMNMI